ncbi:putative NBD/HSP70 family sugar kinase [Streptomyces sp. KhCrAH-43]|uniref:ROK family transcriptional regulator n=1 Tax=unclassified Streptomyces TaxID=2593676 RepID=UPI000DC54B16|nr:ROK family protein [Streptomyces sp. KhCrAH-43]RAJ67700.1 putative NBD/HSP70 family sugar kinase [Streptomyces sp. KhCrAH-43]
MTAPRGSAHAPRKPTSREVVLRLVSHHGSVTRAQLMDLSGLPRTTVYDAVAALVDSGAITTAPVAGDGRGRGRPVERLSLNPGRAQFLGIEFTRRATRVALANDACQLMGVRGAEEPSTAGWQDRVRTAHRLARVLAGGSLGPGSVKGVGVGIGGPGSVRSVAAGGPGAARPGPEVEVAHLVRERFAAPVRVERGYRLAALGEATWGAAAGEPDLLSVSLSREVGGGLIQAGALHRGPYATAGELGHVNVERENGRPCHCGGRGCLETVASSQAVLDRYHACGGLASDLADLAVAARNAEEAACRVLAETGRAVGGVLAALANTFAPAVIVIGGALTRTGTALMDPLKRELHELLVPTVRPHLSLRAATLGTTATACGAVALVAGAPVANPA